MITYLTAFIFYTLAMVGILIGGFVIYKKTFAPFKNEHKGMISVLDTYSVAPKKSLLVVKVKNENFLIALDAERTTFLAKLEGEVKKSPKIPEELRAKYDIEDDIRQELEEAMVQKSPRYDDIRKMKNEEIQKQFMELYSKGEPEAHNMQNDDISQRRQMIRHLINELNQTKTTQE